MAATSSPRPIARRIVRSLTPNASAASRADRSPAPKSAVHDRSGAPAIGAGWLLMAGNHRPDDRLGARKGTVGWASRLRTRRRPGRSGRTRWPWPRVGGTRSQGAAAGAGGRGRNPARDARAASRGGGSPWHGRRPGSARGGDTAGQGSSVAGEADEDAGVVRPGGEDQIVDGPVQSAVAISKSIRHSGDRDGQCAQVLLVAVRQVTNDQTLAVAEEEGGSRRARTWWRPSTRRRPPGKPPARPAQSPGRRSRIPPQAR